MNEQVKNNIMEYKQKYLQKLTDAQVPEKLEKQLEEMDWTCLELIHRKKQQRGTFAPLQATELSEIRKKEDLYRECMAQLNRFESLTGVRPAHFDAHSVMTKAMARAFERVGKQTGIHNPVSQEKQPDRFVMVYELPMRDRDGSSILSRGARPEDWLNDSAGLLECPHPINVLHFHPGYVDKYILEHSSLTTPRCYDLETLCDPSVKEWIQKNQIILTDFDHVLADRQS